MHRRWKKRLTGAISIFLTIIFVSNYALIGLLVDSGRLRMARAVAEGALDNAGASVLSYYNRMLYDLYGLFATDSLTAASASPVSCPSLLSIWTAGSSFPTIRLPKKIPPAARRTTAAAAAYFS